MARFRGRMILGLDAGGSHLKVVAADGERFTEVECTPLPGDRVMEFVGRAALRLVGEHRPVALGLGLAGLVDSTAGVFTWGPHLPERMVKVVADLEERLGVPVTVDNDANLAALAESRLGAGRDASPMLLVALGTGIGTGLVIDGALFRGRGFAGETGHMALVEDGLPCACGSRGCWETLVSGSVLDRAASERWGDGHTGADLAAAAGRGDPVARTVLAEAGAWLGRGLVNLTLMLDPHIIVIGGAAADPMLVESAAAHLDSALPGRMHRTVPVVKPARFGRFSGAIGAALAAGECL